METIEFARKLRREQTPEESIVWGMLRGRRFHGYKFKRQVPIGPFFADFACDSERLIVEIDGSQHLEEMAKDDTRTALLQEFGYNVVRLSNHEVRTDLDAVRAEIAAGLGLVGVV